MEDTVRNARGNFTLGFDPNGVAQYKCVCAYPYDSLKTSNEMIILYWGNNISDSRSVRSAADTKGLEPPKETTMANQKYLLIQRGPCGQPEQAPSPEQMQEMYAVFSAWSEKFKDNIVDMGGKLDSGGKILTATGVTDGPFMETKEIVGGFMIVSADSYEKALEVARESPGLMMPGSSIEIREMTTA